MNQTNQKIRRAAGGAGVHLWQVAEAMGVSEFTLSRKLRHEVSKTEEEQILNVIQNLSTDEK